jgi:hypothetical protein
MPNTIASMLSLCRATVMKHLAPFLVPPQGYFSVKQAADAIGMKQRTIIAAIHAGEMRRIYYNGHVYVKMEWVYHWIDNNQYRQQARALARKALSIRPQHSPVEHPAPGITLRRLNPPPEARTQ